MSKLKNYRDEWILSFILLCVLIFTFIINLHISHHVLDDDASSELMLSNLIHEEKSLFSNDWCYYSEIILYNQIIYGFLFNFFDGWANVRFFGTCFIQIIYLSSFMFMMSRSGLKRDAQLLGGILILIPFCVSYGRLFLYHCFYIPKQVPCFLILGVFFTIIKFDDQKDDSERLYRIIHWILLIILIFINCTLFVRQFIISVVPLSVCLFFYLISKSSTKKTPYKKWMLIPVMMVLIGLLGFYINSKIIIPALNLYQQSDQNLNFLSPQFWEPIFTAFLYQFGFRSQVKLISIIGILSLGGCFCAIVFIYWSIQNLFKNKSDDFRMYVLSTMMPITMILNLFIFLFGEVPFRLQMDYSRYMTQATVWCIPILCCRFHTKECFPHIRKCIYILCLIVFLSNGFYNGLSFLHTQNFGQLYDGLAYTNPHLADDLQNAIEFIRVHDYDYGYAFAGEANVLVELMNGLPVVSIRRTPDYVFEYTNWLSVKSWKTLQKNSAFFLMTENDESSYEKALSESGAERIYFDDDGYVIYDISDLARFRNLIREPISLY